MAAGAAGSGAAFFEKKIASALQLHQQGRLEDAERLYREILRKQPRHFDVLHMLGVLNFQRGSGAEAEKYLRAALQVREDATALSHLGLVLATVGRFEEALPLLERALQLDQNLAEAHNNRANVLRGLGRREEALVSYDRALLIRPQYVDALNNRAVVLHELGRFEEALVGYQQVIDLQPNHARSLSNRSAVLLALNRPEEALAGFDRALRIRPDSVEALNNKGIVLLQLGRFEEALASFDGVLSLKPDHAGGLGNRGMALRGLKRLDEALACLDQSLRINPDQAEIFNYRGVVLQELGRFQEALESFDRALALKPDHAEALSNRGVTLRDLKRFVEALESLDRAVALKPDYAEAFSNRGNVLKDLNRLEEALASFDRAIQFNPHYAEAFSNRGNTLKELNRLEEALASYDQALSLRPDYAEALNNRGNALKELKRFDEALASFARALALKPGYAEALNNRGNVLKELRRFAEAVDNYQQALASNPHQSNAFSQMLDCIRQLCDWSRYYELSQTIHDRINTGRDVIYPFISLSWSDEPVDQLICAQTYIKDKLGHGLSAYTPEPSPVEDRIRIAYLSANFNQHAVAFLIAELFELHDRGRFAVLGVSFGTDDRSAIRNRLERSFDEFHDVRTLDDRSVAELLIKKGVRIVVDLMGYTQDGRAGILARRPAPIQVNYLGYPGTMGAEFMDYIVVDPFVAPMDQQPFYAEKLVQLPDCYQVNDRKRKIAEATPARAECGLPEQGFVFCSFNNSYKLTPFMFDIWMRLLGAVPGSVLWLLRDNEPMMVNLRKEAEQRGVAPERLVFAPRCPLPEHLARQRLADLFLDTLPYNAHTTASDALWVGLPVLTCPGKSFQARVAGSLLHAVGLPELVTGNLGEYEALALALAREPQRLRAIREKLLRQRETMPLFDTERFCRHLESAYETMYQRWREGKTPRAFEVSSTVP